MQLTLSRLNVAAYEGDDPPHEIIERQANEVWFVSHDAIRLDAPVQWRRQMQGGHVYIPLLPYLMVPEADMALIFMFQLGARISFDFSAPIRKLHVAVGHPVHEVARDERTFWQVQLGFGVVLE